MATMANGRVSPDNHKFEYGKCSKLLNTSAARDQTEELDCLKIRLFHINLLSMLIEKPI